MNIAGLRVRITIQRNEVYEDEDGNRLNRWQDYYRCWATALRGKQEHFREHPMGYPVQVSERNTASEYRLFSWI